MSVFAIILGTELVNEELTNRIISIFKRMQSALPADVIQGTFSSLSPELQKKLQQIQ
jgi:hypothetical protein